MNFEICIIGVDDLQIHIENTFLHCLAEAGRQRRCLPVHTYNTSIYCMCLRISGFLCVEASNDIDMESVYGTVRDYRYVLKCLFTRLQFLPYI